MKFSKALLRAIAIALLCVSLSISTRAQNIFGSIVGTVSDTTGAVLPKATVTVTNLQTGEKRTAPSDGQGNYQILALSRGQYKVEVDSSGFKRFSRSPIDVVVNQTARVDVTMAVGDQNQVVTVNSAPPIMQTESASLGEAVEGKAVETLPLNGRNVLALVALVPGVVPQGSSSQNLSGQNVFAAGNYQIGGGSANQSAVLVDGASVNTSYGNAASLVMDQDSVQEFNVQTHNNTAEFGDYTGGVINMSTKSGSNAFHGETYEYVRNTLFDANTFFANRAHAGRQNWHQNQFGGNLGGRIKKDKVFFFGDYQGYRQTQGIPITGTVPTTGAQSGTSNELAGDFSSITAPIYDPLTTCGYNGNPACTPAQIAGTAPTRQQFSYNGKPNVIPPTRLSTVAKNLLAFPIYALPNQAGTPSAEGPVNNFFVLGIGGGKNDQYTVRSDQNLSSKQTAFERYTRWKSTTVPTRPFGNGIDNVSPEDFTTQQIVVGDTYVLNPTSVADVHLSYLRWNYTRLPNHLGLDEAKAFGWPSYMNFGSLNNLPQSTTQPQIRMNGPISYLEGGQGYIFSLNNNYAIAATYQKILKRHTFKIGVDLRRQDMNYFQNNAPGGTFSFDNVFTAKNAAAAGTTGNGLASFLLGYAASGTVQVQPPVFQRMYYQGYFGQDTWQVTNKLTATLGLRYEVPGQFIAGHGWMDTFNPTETNPIVTNNGAPVLGAFDLVSTPQHPSAGTRNENWNNWSPRVGAAYRVTNNTVVRAAWGMFFIPSDLYFGEAPLASGINLFNNLMINSTNGQQTPFNTFDNPYPNGLQSAPHRDPSYQQILLGGNAQADLVSQPSGKTYQWNVAIEHQFPLGIALTTAYSGLKGANLPLSNGGFPLNGLPDSVIATAAADHDCSIGNFGSCFLNQQVTNPFYPKITQGILSNATVTQNQLLRPFPQYGQIGSSSGRYEGISNYQALEVTLKKRMSNGGQILGAYTFSKLMSNAETLTTWLESTGSAGFQDYNNPAGEYSLSSFDTRQRLVVSYLYPLPFGKGQLLFSHISGAANALIGGWGLDGITTFQEGWPLALTVSNNILSTYAFQGSERPNVVAGCGKKIGGSVFNRLGGSGSTSTYFNTSCFTNPNFFTYGNESRTDNSLRGAGIANWDMSLHKDFSIKEGTTFQLRAEAFNMFNRVQFGNPNTSLGNTSFGFVTSQNNNPRLLQFSGRIDF